METRPELAILIGLQAAGKSTFYKNELSRTHAWVSKDLMRGAKGKGARQARMIEAALREGKSVAVDNTSPSRRVRAPLIEQGKSMGASVVAYYFEPDLQGSLNRNRERRGKSRVPDVAIHVAHRNLEPPAADEGFDAIYGVELGRQPRILFRRVDVPEKSGP